MNNRIEAAYEQRGRNAAGQAQRVYRAGRDGRGKPGEGYDNNGRGNDYADYRVEGRGVPALEQVVHRPREADHGDHSANHAGDYHAEIQRAEAGDEGRVQAERHKQRGEAHAGRDHAHCQTEAAEQVPAEIRRDFDRQIVQYEQQSEECGESDGHADIILAGHRPL